MGDFTPRAVEESDMVDDDHPVTPGNGDQYEHPDGTMEVVFTVEDGRVLTIREYPDTGTFASAVDDARFGGTHEEIASLPPAEYFAEEE